MTEATLGPLDIIIRNSLGDTPMAWGGSLRLAIAHDGGWR